MISHTEVVAELYVLQHADHPPILVDRKTANYRGGEVKFSATDYDGVRFNNPYVVCHYRNSKVEVLPHLVTVNKGIVSVGFPKQ